jgi:hypothetical protein
MKPRRGLTLRHRINPPPVPTPRRIHVIACTASRPLRDRGCSTRNEKAPFPGPSHADVAKW